MTKIISILPTKLTYKPDDIPYTETQQVTIENTGTETVTFTGISTTLDDITVSHSITTLLPSAVSGAQAMGFNSDGNYQTQVRIRMVSATKGVLVQHQTTTTTRYRFFTINPLTGAITPLTLRSLTTISGVDIMPLSETRALVTYTDTDGGIKACVYEINVDLLENPGAVLLLNASGRYDALFTHTTMFMLDAPTRKVFCGYDLTSHNTARARIITADLTTKVVTAYAETATTRTFNDVVFKFYDTSWGVAIAKQSNVGGNPCYSWIFEISGNTVSFGNEMVHVAPGNTGRYDVLPISSSKYFTYRYDNVNYRLNVYSRSGTTSTALNTEVIANLSDSTGDRYMLLVLVDTLSFAILVHERFYWCTFNNATNDFTEDSKETLGFSWGSNDSSQKGVFQPDFPTISKKMIYAGATGTLGTEINSYWSQDPGVIDLTLNTSSFKAQKGVLVIQSDASSSPDYVEIEIGNVFSPLYVRSWGNDSTGDGSFSKPYKTLNKASQEPGAGLYFEVDVGDLSETISGSVDFTSNNFIINMHPSAVININQLIIDPSKILVFKGGKVNVSTIME